MLCHIVYLGLMLLFLLSAVKSQLCSISVPTSYFVLEANLKRQKVNPGLGEYPQLQEKRENRTVTKQGIIA